MYILISLRARGGIGSCQVSPVWTVPHTRGLATPALPNFMKRSVTGGPTFVGPRLGQLHFASARPAVAASRYLLAAWVLYRPCRPTCDGLRRPQAA